LKKLFWILALFVVCLGVGVALAASDPNDKEGSKDPPLFNRMPGYHIYRYEDIQFDQFEFRVGPDKTQTVEGRHLYIIYDPNDNIQAPSPLQIGRNYLNAIKAVGGQLVYEYHDPGEDIVLKITKNGTETWAYLNANGNDSYSIHIIEKQLMNQDVVADASSLAKGIKESGKAAIYGIYFDTGKAEIKPESEPSLKEIAKLLQTNPKLKLYIVGHTDNVGGFDNNMKLSKDRADAVLKALTGKYGIAATRLQANGVGPLSPVETNQTEEGRAKNRRVELVAQ
jgi:OmpA-OmpF porin, OOP family